MKNLTILAASALMAAPMCMVAHAEPTTIQDFANESIDLINRMASILEKTTPATADACVAEMNAFKGKVAELKAAETKFSDEEKAKLVEDKDLEEKMKAAMNRMIQAAVQLSMTVQKSSPEDQAKLMKVVQAMQSLDM